MPIYEYRCRACGHTFSRLQKIGADTAEVTCPSCGAQDAEREVSTFASSGSAGPGSPGAGCGTGGFT